MSEMRNRPRPVEKDVLQGFLAALKGHLDLGQAEASGGALIFPLTAYTTQDKCTPDLGTS